MISSLNIRNYGLISESERGCVGLKNFIKFVLASRLLQCNKNMRTFFKNIIVTVVLVLSLFSFETKGQIGSVYPVDLNVMLTPPYGTCLTDLSNSNRFVIQALLRDMNHGNNYEMLIQMRVKSLSSMNTVFLSYSNKFSIGIGKPAVVLGAGNTPVSISNFF